MKDISWYSLILGVWLLVSPAVLFMGGGIATSNAVLCGLAVIAVSAWSLTTRATNVVPAWLNLVLGAWMAVSAWVLGFADFPAALWNAVIVGLLLMVSAIGRMTPNRVMRGPLV